jgi:hypothetical protein
VVAQVILLHRAGYMEWFEPVLIVGCALAVVAQLAVRRLAAPAMAATVGLLLVAPGVYASTTWQAPVQGTFPSAGPHAAAGPGGLGVTAAGRRTNLALFHYISSHRPAHRWALLTDASDTASPLILMGLRAGALGGYSGTDPALDGAGLARLVARGEARYVVIGGAYSKRGGNAATAAAQRACERLPGRVWRAGLLGSGSLILYDCRGDARELANPRARPQVGAQPRSGAHRQTTPGAHVRSAHARPALTRRRAHGGRHARTARSHARRPSAARRLHRRRAAAARRRRRLHRR